MRVRGWITMLVLCIPLSAAPSDIQGTMLFSGTVVTSPCELKVLDSGELNAACWYNNEYTNENIDISNQRKFKPRARLKSILYQRDLRSLKGGKVVIIRYF